MANARVDVQGIKETRRKLARLHPKKQKRGIGNSLRAGARVVRKAARRRAPVGPTGNLRARVVIKSLRRLRTGELGYVIVRPKAPHSGLVQRGTRKRKQKTTGRNTGAMPANAFMAEAAKESEAAAGRKAREILGKHIEREAKR